MAEVWEGVDEVLARSVAIKVLHRHLAGDRAFIERFRREAIAAARLAHPNVVTTYDAATEDDEAFIVMELVRGRSVRRVLSDDGPFSAERAVTIGSQVATALAHAHAQGLIHRDIKPANILLCEDADGSVQAKVADFGIAKAMSTPDGELTMTGSIVGTAKYLAPEQVEGHEPDGRSDIYALGITLYEMLCGRAPFSGDTELATALAHLRSDPTPPRRIRPGIPAPLEAAVLHAMARDPEDRPPTAAAFRAELTDIDLGTDDATSLIVRDPTPPAGSDMTSTLAPPRRPSGSRRVLPGVLVVVVIVAVGVLLGLLFSRSGPSPSPSKAPPPAAGAAVPVSSVKPFDPPPGDGTEHDELAALAVDGDPSTFWETSHYNGPHFGGLKPGVGLILQLNGPTALRQLHVTTSTTGWSADVYVASSPGGTLADWGAPVATQSGIQGDATFDLGHHTGGAVLLWITDPGPDFHAQINEVSLTG
jgi:serine/threonine-protein kinase